MQTHYEKLTKMLAGQSYDDLRDPDRRAAAKAVVRHIANAIDAADLRPSNVISLDARRRIR